MKCYVALLILTTALCGCEEQQGFQKAQDAVRETLTDPDSAQFRNLTQNESWVCGEVNAKNRMGGYAGFREFAANKATNAVEMGPEDLPADLGTLSGLAMEQVKLDWINRRGLICGGSDKSTPEAARRETNSS